QKSSSTGVITHCLPHLMFSLKTEALMPYKAKSDLPDNVRNVLPAHAQDIYKEAFNSAWEQYKDKADRRDDASREETAHKVAWAAVKNDYEKGEDDKWHKKK
ncbi:cation transport regulator, partial [Salmonella enterica subsp. enterica serovar Havana str. CFSAN001082]